jgi:hypothetical protein
MQSPLQKVFYAIVDSAGHAVFDCVQPQSESQLNLLKETCNRKLTDMWCGVYLFRPTESHKTWVSLTPDAILVGVNV